MRVGCYFRQGHHNQEPLSDPSTTTALGRQTLRFDIQTDNSESLPWDTVIVSSWTSVVEYGETQVWDDGHVASISQPSKERVSPVKSTGPISFVLAV
jgi:hypothetical protein